MTAIQDHSQPAKTGPPVPPDIKDKLRRGREAMRKHAALRRVCQKFWEGDHYWYVNSKNTLSFLPNALVDVQGGKPLHRIRNTYNFTQSIVESKVSAASQRVPGFQIDPSSADPEDWAGARIAEQVSFWGYDQWRWRRATNKTITNALVQREGFVYPYFDPNVGPFTENENGDWEGQGEVRLLNLTRSEVMWEPAQDFEESRWHGVERAMLKDDVRKLPGYIGGALQADADTADVPSEKRSEEMVLVTEFLERPCPDYPQGRRCFIAGGRIIVDYRKVEPEAEDWWESYPSLDADGKVSDELVLHRLSYTVAAEGDDLGLVERVLDLQRTINDCWNKLLEWKNRCLFPQMIAQRGMKVARRSDTPGEVIEYNPAGGAKPEWERTPPVPRELFDMLSLAIEQMRALAADVDVQADPGLAARTANAAIETSKARWQSFLGDLADFHSRLMRHCLMLVARYYTQQRIIDIRGQYGWEPTQAFTGQDLRSQVNVRVLPGSIEAKTRQQALQDIQMLQQFWPGSVSPEAALAVLHGGPAEGLLQSYDKDVARAWRVVQMLRQGPQAMLLFKPRLDMTFGDPTQGFMVPGWMPRKQDNIAIWKQVVADYTKTTDYDAHPPEVQEMFQLIYDGLEMAEKQRAMNIAMQEQSMAAAQGMGNAAAPQNAAAMPQQPALSREQAAPAALSPQQ